MQLRDDDIVSPARGSLLVVEENQAEVMKLIALAEGKAWRRTMRWKDVQARLDRLEKLLRDELYLPKRDWSGLKFFIGIGWDEMKIPNSYHGRPASTVLIVRRARDGWRIEGAGRGGWWTHDVMPHPSTQDDLIRRGQAALARQLRRRRFWFDKGYVK